MLSMLDLPQPIVPLIQLMLKRRKGTKSLTIRLDHSSDGRKTGNRKTKLNLHNLYVYIYVNLCMQSIRFCPLKLDF